MGVDQISRCCAQVSSQQRLGDFLSQNLEFYVTLLISSGEETLGLVFLRLLGRHLWYVDRLLSSDHQKKLNIFLLMYRCFRDAGHVKRTLSHNVLVEATFRYLSRYSSSLAITKRCVWWCFFELPATHRFTSSLRYSQLSLTPNFWLL